jgi:hypothetical protein
MYFKILIVDICILKDKKVFECFFNAFGCISFGFYCIYSVFQ